MSRQNPFALHYQGVWVERSTNPLLPAWLRVAFLAYGKHTKNGHANFSSGELAKLLSKPGPNGEPKPISDSAVSNAIKRAKEQGYIAEDSMARCLVVPRHAVVGGLGGNESTKCRFHSN